jgi:Zn-dependent peptidase ImmA (M78 family)
VQALGHVVLDHQVPREYVAFLEQRVEINYFAAALLIPERGALTLLRKAKTAKDIAI